MSGTTLAMAFQRPWPTTRRGLCLWLFSVAFISLGLINYVFSTPSPEALKGLAFVTDFAPLRFWGVVMTACGVLSAAYSYYHFGRDKYGFTLLAVFCNAWGLVYVCGYVAYDAGIRSLGSSVIWLLFSGILQLIAGFPNVPLKSSRLDPPKES